MMEEYKMDKSKENCSKLGEFIKNTLKQQSLSMRKFSQITGIDTATISRITNGKQEANLNHLCKFSKHLHIPMPELLKAAGYNMESLQGNKGKSKVISNAIDETLKYFEFSDEKYFVECIEKQLIEYEQYALTEEGTQIILEKFQDKIVKISGIGIYIKKLKEMYKEFCKKDISPKKRAVIGSGLLYFILPTDTIPDYVFPLGYLDDIIAMKLVSDKLDNLSKSRY